MGGKFMETFDIFLLLVQIVYGVSWVFDFSFFDLALKTSYPVQMFVADFRCYANILFFNEVDFSSFFTKLTLDMEYDFLSFC